MNVDLTMPLWVLGGLAALSFALGPALSWLRQRAEARSRTLFGEPLVDGTEARDGRP